MMHCKKLLYILYVLYKTFSNIILVKFECNPRMYVKTKNYISVFSYELKKCQSWKPLVPLLEKREKYRELRMENFKNSNYRLLFF